MKKSVKILTLVLSLALLCGALVVAAFADETPAVTGVKTWYSTNFDGAKGFGTGDGTPITGFTIDNKGSGESKAVISDDGNTYFSWDYTGNTGTATGNYSYTAPTGSPGAWGNPDNANPHKWQNFYYTAGQYVVVDYDVWFPKDVPSGCFTSYIYSYYVNQKVTVDAETGAETTTYGNSTEKYNVVKVQFYNSENGGIEMRTMQNDGAVKYAANVLDGAWNHITMIVEPSVKDNVLSLTVYYALNGVVVDKVTTEMSYAAGTTSSNNAMDGNWTYWYPKTARFDFGGGDKSGNISNLDNFAFRQLSSDYNGNLATVLAGGVGADLTAWESNLYSLETIPFTTAAAAIGDKQYDHIDRAIAAAKEGETIKLLANAAPTAKIDKVLNIECGEFTMAQPSTAAGLVPTYDEETKTWTIAETQESLFILWDVCTCPLCLEADEPDPTHPGSVEAEGYLNNKIFDYYKEAGKSTTWSYANGPVTYVLVGWVDENGNLYDEKSVITQELLDEGMLFLTPVIENQSATVEYTKNGETKYASTIKAAIDGVSDNGTIKLLANTKIGAVASISTTKNITINLNGHVLDAFLPYHYDSNSFYDNATGKPNSKVTTFKTGTNKTLTFIGEEAGSAIISGSALSTTSVRGTFLSPNAGSTTNFKGQNLVVSVPQLVGTWGAANYTINIDGGYYATTAIAFDGAGFIYGNASSTGVKINIKNAYFKGSIAAASGAGMIANIENSIIGTTIYSSSYKDVTFNITDCYITGAIKTTANYSGTCYFTDTSVFGQAYTTIASGYAAVTEKSEITHSILTHEFALEQGEDGKYYTAASTYTTPATSVATTYWGKTVEGVTVTFKNGDEVLGTAAAKAGTKVIGPAAGAPEAVADGWVMASKAYTYSIPADATADITVDVKDITEFDVTYTAGTPKLYLNYRLTDNLATNLYRPATLPEGIELVDTILNGTNKGRSWSGNWTIDGEKYVSTQGWPIAWNADDDNPVWELQYTYAGNTFSYTIKANVVTYATKAATIYTEDTEKMTQITALLQYVEAANKIKMTTDTSETIGAGLSELLTELKAKYTLPAIPEAQGNIAALAPAFITGVKVGVNSGRGGSMIFTLSEAAKADGVTFKLSVAGSTAAIVTESKNGTIAIDNTSLTAWGASELTIKVLDANGAELATGTYSLAAYYTAMGSELSADEFAMLQSIYALAAIGDTNN